MFIRFSALNMMPSAELSKSVLICCVHRAERNF